MKGLNMTDLRFRIYIFVFLLLAFCQVGNSLYAANISGLDSTYCLNSSPATLAGTPVDSLGYFSGPGIVADTFFPALADTGLHTIYYHFQDSSLIWDSTFLQVRVFPIPAVFLSGLSITYCQNSPPDTLGGTPLGGFFSGDGMSGNVFIPANVITPGLVQIIYSFTDGNGCTNAKKTPTIVQPSPTAGISGLAANYCLSAPFAPLTGTPTGGTFSGPGMLGNDFYPAVAGVGLHSISYDYTDTSTGCANQFSQITRVNANPNASFSGLSLTYCIDGSIDTLHGTPSGGIFSGAGITDSIFSPLTAGSGLHSIQYSVTDLNGCSDTTSQIVSVYALPAVIFFGLQNQYCQGEPEDTLTGFPTGGSFSGMGMTGNIFSPDSLGNSSITYTYTDAYGCTDIFQNSTNIDTVPNVNLVSQSTFYTPQDQPDTLAGSPSGGAFSGPGVTGGIFYPSLPGIGNFPLVYSFTDGNGCTSTDTALVLVDTNLISGLAPTYCFNDSFALLTGYPMDSLGYFTGAGIVGDTFFPALADTGLHIIYYHFQDTVLGFDSVSQQVRVHPLPIVFFSGLSPSYCQFDPGSNLAGIPSGGLFQGPGIFNSIFTPDSSGYHSISYVFTDNNGCTNSYQKNVTVDTIPKVNFTVGSFFTPQDPPEVLLGTPVGGTFSGNGVASGIFYPSIVQVGSHALVYSFTDSNGCTASDTAYVNVDTTLITGLAKSYCLNAQFSLLSGNPFDPLGSFSGPGIVGDTFFPALADTGLHTIYYHFNDTVPGPDSVSKKVRVHPLPQVSFTQLAASYCQFEAGDTLIGIPAGGVFSGIGIQTGDHFHPDSVGSFPILYVYSDANGCTANHQQSVTVNPLPVPGFTVADTCENESALFWDLSTIPFPDSITIWNWDFGDGTTSLAPTPISTFSLAGNYKVVLTVESKFGCIDSTERNLHIGWVPNVDFSWSNECKGDQTLFSDSSTLSLDIISSRNWNFGDGSVGNGLTIPHSYSVSGDFEVSLEVISNHGCKDTSVKSIHIFPTFPANAYPFLEDFEGGKRGWYVDSSGFSSWQFGKPVGGSISSAGSGDSAWVTNLSGGYNNNEHSLVFSPCFDLSLLKRPMISLKFIDFTEFQKDGVVLQASKDGGWVWENLGEVGKGVNWYNADGIEGDPGLQGFNPEGWSGASSNWRTARYKLDNYAGLNGIRFRFALGTNSNLTTEGFAFDDFAISERRKMLLLEEFTNSSQPLSGQLDQGVFNLINANQNDVVGLFYHTLSSAGSPADPMNQDNPTDVSGREIYYGFTSPPWAALDGNYFSGSPNLLSQEMIDLRSLEDAIFVFDSLELTISGSQISARARIDFIPDSSFSADIQLQMAIVERQISTLVGANGQTNFEWVMKKMLPDAGGTLYTTSWNPGDVAIVNESWNYATGNVYDPAQLGLIAFLQNKNTKEVYQAAYTGPQVMVSNDPEVLLPPQTDLVVFPNPAHDQLNIKISSGSISEINLINLLGQNVFSSQVGNDYFHFELNGIPNGVYLIEVKSGQETLQRKVVISH